MSSTNLYLFLQGLQPPPVQLKGQITAQLTGGMCNVQLIGAGLLQARNPTGLAVGKWVYLKDASIVAEAPALPTVRIEI